MATGLSLLGLDDKEENPLFLSKEEALSTDVLPRSRGFEPAPRTALAVPSSSATPTPAGEERMSLASILDAKLSAPVPQTTGDLAAPAEEKRQSLSSILDSKFGVTVPSTEPAAKPAEETGDFLRGGATALGQTPALAYGALGLAGAAGEKVFGEGGSMSSLKKFGLNEYQTRMKEIGATAKDTDDVTKAWARAKQGDLGALVDWAQYGVGYLGGNIVETVATSALGGLVGGFAAGPAAPAGAVAGAATGVVARDAVKGVTKNLIEGMVAKEAARLAEKAGVETATDVMLKEATKNVAKSIGSGVALAGSSIIKETGGIYGEAEEQATKEGRELSSGDLARVFGSGVLAGLSEFATDKLGLEAAAGRIKIPGGGRTGRALIGGAAGVGAEGGTELFQTAVERFGAGKTLTGEDAMNEYINAFALGGLGGGTVGAVVGAFRDGKASADRVRQILDQAKADMTSDDGRQELFDAMYDDPKIGAILQANNIESGDDPRFQDVIIKALATQRMLVDLEAPTPEVRAETRKQREADILAAFGETASTAVGGNTGAIEPVIQRSSVTPNEDTRTLEGEAQPVILPETTGGQAGTVALSPEDLAARREGFEPLVGIQTEAGPVANRFSLVIDAVEFLEGKLDQKTQQRTGGYAQAVLDKQGLEARIRRGKQSAAEGGNTFYFIETRKKPTEAAPVVTAPAPAVTPAAPVVTPSVTPTKGKKATIPALTPEEEQQQIPLRTRAEEIANELETLGGDKNLIQGIRSTVANKSRIQNNDFYESKLAELKALKGVGVQKVTEQRNLSAYLSSSKRDQGRYNEYIGNADIGPFLQSANDAIQQLTTFINNLGYAVADVNNATPDKRALFAKNLMSQIAGSTSRMLLKREAFDKKYKSANLEQKNKSLVDLQKDLVAAQEYLTKQGEPNATQTRQVTEGGQPKREDTGGGLQTVGENRNVTPQEQTNGSETGGSNKPVEGGAQPQEVKPAVDPALQARIKDRINKAYEESGLDLEDVVKLNKMVDDGDLAGAVAQMKKIVENNLGAGAGARFSMSREQQTTTTGRDFSYAKLKTVDDLNSEVRAYLKRQGSTGTFTAKRVPLGDIVGKVPGISAVQRVAALFGKKPVYFAVEEGSINDFDGAVLSGSDTIFINVNSSRPHIRIFGHELVHSLRASNNSTYRRLVNSLTPLLDQAGMLDYAMVMGKEGVKDPALILEEAIGDIVGDRFGESAFWQMLADDNPTMFEQVARIVMDFIDNVLAKLRGDQSLGSKNLVTDLNAVRRAVADVLGSIQQPTQEAAVQAEAGIQFSRSKENETFYSAMERGFESVKQASMPAQQWKAWLNSNKSKLGIKNAEIEWTGIEEWLDLQEGKVEKQDILNWIAGNKVQLNDIILDGSGKYLSDDDILEMYSQSTGEYIEDITLTRQEMIDEMSLPEYMLKGTKHNRATGRTPTVLPYGKDYFELVLTEPSIAPYNDTDTIHFGDVAGGKHIGWIRANIRKDTEGNDVLFLEEIQSQRAQSARDVGIVDGKNKDIPSNWTVEESFDKYGNSMGWAVLNDSKTQVGLYGDTKEEAIQSALASGVPNAPFIKETKSWVALLIKRAIAYAQTKGIDRISWTTGDQQNQRYRLSESVDEIYYDKYDNGAYEVSAQKDGKEIGIGSGRLTLGRIRQIYGKDIAKMIEDGSGEKTDAGVSVIRGKNLDAGGSGMREFYDVIVPSVARSIIGKSGTVDVMYAITRDPYMDSPINVVGIGDGKYQLMRNVDGEETPVSKKFDSFDEAKNSRVSMYAAEDMGATPQLGFVIPESLQEQVANDGFPMFSRRRYEEQFSDLDDKTKEAAIRKGYYTPPTIKERLDHLKPRIWDRIIQGTFDKFRAVRGVSEKAYMMLRMSAGSQDGAVSTLLHYGQVFDDDGALNVKKGTSGLLDVLKPVGGEVDRFLLWIAANRAANLSKDERERFFKPEDIRMLQKLNMGTMKDGSSRVGVYAEALKNMNELNRSVLDVARSTGLIDAEAYKRFSADIWYVPFYRQMEDDGSLSAAQTSSGAVGQYLSKKLKGSDRPLNDLMENVLMNWTHILSASMKNKAAVETLKAASDMGDIVTKLPAQMKGAVKVMEGGKETYYQIDDEFLMNSLTAVAQAPSYGFWMDTARGFKTTLTRFISLSPTFKINNLIRDSIQSIGLSELSNNPMGNVLQGWRAYKDDRAEALAGGGLFAMGNAFDGDQSAAVKRLLKTGVNKADILDTKEKAAAFFASVQDKYDELSDASENANRLALYQQLRAKGASHLEASYAARDLQDFSLQGGWTAIRYASQVLPYFNARLQGMYKLGRDGLDPTMQVLTGKASDTERQKAAKFATVTGAVVTVAMILYLSQKDDDDWKKREDWDRDAFFWFKLPGTDKAVRIPKPFEMGAIATIVERALEQMVDSSVEGKVFGQRLLHVLTDNFAINPIPQAVRPIYDIARNKDGFTDRPIESMGMERISVENRVSPGTSGAAVAIGTINSMFAEFASKVTGGAINSQSVQLSPIQYDYMIKGYLGWVGTGIQTASNVMATPFKDGASSRYERIDDYLVVGNFVKTVPQSQSRYVTSFYENAKDIATASADVSHFLNAGQFEKANEIYLAKADKLALAKLYNKGTNMMSSISNQIKMVEDDKVMTGAQKRLEIERLQQVRIQIAKDVEDVRISSKKK